MAKTATKPAATKKVEAEPSKAVTTKPATSTAVAESNVDVMLLMRQNAGAGVSTSADDNVIPLIYLLQAQSPQALRQKPEYISGAQAGSIWPKGTKTIIDGDEGLPVILAATRRYWVEWKPERAGFVTRHEYNDKDTVHFGRPSDAHETTDPKNPDGKIWVRESGNLLVDTREHAVLAFFEGLWNPCVIAMSGSNHQCAKLWNGERLRKRFDPPNDNFIPPAFSFVYTLKTIAASNAKGDWYKWAHENGMGDGETVPITSLDNGVELLKMAIALKDAFMSGAKTAEAPMADAPATDDGDL